MAFSFCSDSDRFDIYWAAQTDNRKSWSAPKKPKHTRLSSRCRQTVMARLETKLCCSLVHVWWCCNKCFIFCGTSVTEVILFNFCSKCSSCLQAFNSFSCFHSLFQIDGLLSTCAHVIFPEGLLSARLYSFCFSCVRLRRPSEKIWPEPKTGKSNKRNTVAPLIQLWHSTVAQKRIR